MNEIALANFYRVLNNEDRFPKEHELAEAAIAAKEELNALRRPAAQQQPDSMHPVAWAYAPNVLFGEQDFEEDDFSRDRPVGEDWVPLFAAPPVQEAGHKWMPREPTPQMLNNVTLYQAACAGPAEIYRAMFDAVNMEKTP